MRRTHELMSDQSKNSEQETEEEPIYFGEESDSREPKVVVVPCRDLKGR